MEQGSGSESSKKKGKPGGSKVVKKVHACNECSKSFSFRCHLIQHQRVHTGDKPFPCDLCSKSFSAKSNLKVHKRKHTREKPFHCDLCPMKFSKKGNLARHKKGIHFPDQVPKIPCPECGKYFRFKDGMIKHQLIHQDWKPFTCVFCPKTCRRRSDLRKHFRRHIKEKSYFCKDCPQSFVTNEKLKIHRSGHTGDKFFKCPHPNCTVAFFYRDLLIAHRRQFHKEDIGVAHLCVFCDNGIEFIRKEELNEHLRRHIDEKWNFCKDCDNCFVTASELSEHSNRKHYTDGEKKYKCYYCSMEFYSSGQMRHHIRRVHENENAEN